MQWNIKIFSETIGLFQNVCLTNTEILYRQSGDFIGRSRRNKKQKEKENRKRKVSPPGEIG
jgi:hypothetical protein